MADDRENQQEEDQRSRKEKKSRSIEETESSSYYDFSENERKQNLRWTESRRRSDERNEIDSRFRAEKKDKEGRIHDYGDSSNQKEQRQRDVERQRRRYETGSRIWREERDNESQIYDYRDSYNQQQHRQRNLEMQRRRYETELWREERDNEGHIYDYRDSSNHQQQRQSDVEMQRRRRYETESWREERERSPRRNDERGPPNESEWRYDERSGRRYELLESGGYVVHPGKNDCFSYFRTGICLNGRNGCKFDHPTQLPQGIPEMTTNAPVCKYFQSGNCKKGSRCDMRHVMNSDDGAEPMPQARSMDPRASDSKCEFDERIEKRRYEIESLHLPPKKRLRTIPDSLPNDLRGTIEDLRQSCHEIEQERKKSPENIFMAIQRARERREAQGNMQEEDSIERLGNLRDLINPIAEAFMREMRRIENDRLSREKSPMSTSQQSNSKK